MGGCERHPFGVIHTAFLTYRLLPYAALERKIGK